MGCKAPSSIKNSYEFNEGYKFLNHRTWLLHPHLRISRNFEFTKPYKIYVQQLIFLCSTESTSSQPSKQRRPMLVSTISYLIEVNRIKSLLKTWIKAFQHLFSLSLNSHLACGAKEQHQRTHVDRHRIHMQL